jgi:hypothetical protein
MKSKDKSRLAKWEFGFTGRACGRRPQISAGGDRKTLMMCIVACAAVAPAAAVTGGGLVGNGGFEQLKQSGFLGGLDGPTRSYYAGAYDSPFADWAFGGRWERGDYAVEVSGTAHTGRRSCRIVCRKRGRGGVASAPFRLKAGTRIEVSCWLKATDALSGRVFLNFEGSPGDGWSSRDLKTGTYDWTKFTARAVVPGQAGAEQTLVVFLYSTCEGSIWIDDFSVETLAAGADDTLAAGARKPKAIAEPEGSVGYRVIVVSPLKKVFREDDYDPAPTGKTEVAAARNEYESVQIVVEAPWRAVSVKQVVLSDLVGPGGAVIPASALTWNPVGYVETTVAPPYYTERGLGSYPDPLLPAGPFTVAALSRQPVWVTIHTPTDCPAGLYRGAVTIVPDGLEPTSVAVTLTVWDFALTDRTHLRMLTWLGGGTLRAWYGNDWTPEGSRRHAEVLHRYEDALLARRLGPGGEVAGQVPKREGKYDFATIDARLERLLGGGMNAFFMATAPNLQRQKKTAYSDEFVRQFTETVKAYADHLREKGWLDMAYVYVYDEAPKSAWPQVQKIDRAIRAAAPGARIFQCLNQPEGVRELTGFADVFDVYVAQYHKAGVAAAQEKGAEVWLAVCCYPMDHPNLFLEYPLLDARVIPLICWKYGAAGFEYWSPISWGKNYVKGAAQRWPDVPWIANTFGRYNGDGYLLYPGPGGVPLSSLRFEALRDGLEDYEYLWTLRSLLTGPAATTNGPAAARKLLSLPGLVTPAGGYLSDLPKYANFRRQLAEAIVALPKPR